METQNTQRPEMDIRPLYVRRLDAERLRYKAELEALQDGLMALRRYLTSPKFRAPSERQFYVNVEDVLLRMDEAIHASVEAADNAVQR